MKFGLFYELQSPRPWSPERERELFSDALEQIELADRLGVEHLWLTEHHFLEEYSHSSAPEVFLGAVSQRTKRIRLGHGVNLTAPAYNHPARVAERIATLDLLSNGRVDWGTGESGTFIELDGFGISPAAKHEMWREGTEQAANMMSMEPYPGFIGQHFSMPCRNIVPKPLQAPHPPLWLACSRRESIHRAARYGMGALIFGFVAPELATTWVKEYYDIIKSDECVPIGHQVNANVAAVCGFSVHEDGVIAAERSLRGLRFLGYALSHLWIFGEHRPGRTTIWKDSQRAQQNIPIDPTQGAIGDIATVTDHLERYERAGVDQTILIQETGGTKHEHILEALELFGTQILPAFQERDRERTAHKAAELEPYLAAAQARRVQSPPPLLDDEIPVIPALGRSLTHAQRTAAFPLDSAAGGAIPMLADDPLAD